MLTPHAMWGDTWRVQIDVLDTWECRRWWTLAPPQCLSCRLWMLALLSPEPGSCCREERFPGKHLGDGAACRLSGFIPSQSTVDGCSQRPGRERVVMSSRFLLRLQDGLWGSPCCLGHKEVGGDSTSAGCLGLRPGLEEPPCLIAIMCSTGSHCKGSGP